jgi:hypothetical protein
MALTKTQNLGILVSHVVGAVGWGQEGGRGMVAAGRCLGRHHTRGGGSVCVVGCTQGGQQAHDFLCILFKLICKNTPLLFLALMGLVSEPNLNVQKIGSISPIFVQLLFSFLPTIMMEKESKQEMCFLCLKPLSQHSHGIKTIPHADLNVLMSHWSVISSKQSHYNRICCKHFKDHDDLLFKFTHVSYPGLRQLEVKWMCFY